MPGRKHTDAGRVDVAPVAVAALDHLGIAGNDAHACCGSRIRHGADNGSKLRQREAFFEDEARAEKLWIGSGDGEIVDGAVHGERADRTARKKQRLHDKGIGAHGNAA